MKKTRAFKVLALSRNFGHQIAISTGLQTADAGDFSVMNRRIVDVLNSMPGRHHFVRGLRAWGGFRQIGLAYERENRTAGKPKYPFGKLVRLAANGIFSFHRLAPFSIYLGHRHIDHFDVDRCVRLVDITLPA